MSPAVRWALTAVIAVGFAALGVVAAARLQPLPAAEPAARATVNVTVTITPTPDAVPAPVVSVTPAGLDITRLSIDEPSSTWVIVNKQRPLNPQTYRPDDLVYVDLPGSVVQLREEAAVALRQMHAAADRDGAPFLMSTAFRTYGFQQGLYNGYVSSKGQSTADRLSARPGYSEHQTGLAADVYDPAGCHLSRCYATTPSGRWVAEHAAEYGFIVRYPDGGEPVTGYTYEPWHLRYVGVDLAEAMADADVATLEEFFGLPAAPDYD